MAQPITIRTRGQAKASAKAVRAEFTARGEAISYSAALELVAHELGYADWNTASARLSNELESPLQVGDRVEGAYLKQAFVGVIVGVRNWSDGAAFEVTVDLDEPVDVVTFESFSAFRRRVSATIAPDGASFAKTSDGVPHLVVARTDAMVI